MDLSEKQKKFLRGIGHQLKPIILIGSGGLTESVINEFKSAINRHELIKVRIRVGDRERRNTIIDELCKNSATTLVTRIGNVALMYQPKKNKPMISFGDR